MVLIVHKISKCYIQLCMWNINYYTMLWTIVNCRNKLIKQYIFKYIYYFLLIRQFFFSSSVNRLCMSQVRTKATLPPLAFEYKDLEPIISRDIMEIHHQKHHNTYVVNYNNTMEKLQTAVSKGCTE